jgi:hypothetical protein
MADWKHLSEAEFVRRELEGFFDRREEQGKLYCASCLGERLIRFGTMGVFPAAWATSVDSAFERPGPLRVEAMGPCVICLQARPCLGAPPGSAPP